MISTLAVAGYRSLRNVVVALDRVTVITGPNGSGKSSLYRALRLLADVAQNRVTQSLAAEGGLASTLWAGPETIARSVKSGDHPVQGTSRRGPVSLKLGFSSDSVGYAIDLGLPIFEPPPVSMFFRDPEIKVEAQWSGGRLGRANILASRNGPAVRRRDENGRWVDLTDPLAPFDSMMTYCDPRAAPDLLALRETMRDWRFYDHLRTDRDAPARRPQVGTYTPILSGDGADLAAALQTIREIGNAPLLASVIEDAFPGSTLTVASTDGYFEIEMRQQGLLRPFRAAELSDGTLRFLLLTAALLSPRPPELMVLNEPETSLHPDLLGPLARLIERASARTQIIVVSHAAALVTAMDHLAGCHHIVLGKAFGETVIDDEATADKRPAPSWTWPSR